MTIEYLGIDKERGSARFVASGGPVLVRRSMPFQAKLLSDCAEENFGLRNHSFRRSELDFTARVVSLQAQGLSSTQGACQIRINTSCLHGVISESLYDASMGPWKVSFGNSSFQQRRAGDVKHRVVGSVYSAVRIAVLQAHDSTAHRSLCFAGRPDSSESPVKAEFLPE